MTTQPATPVVLDPRNAWLWQARETHWVFKKTGDGSSWRHIAPCMDPYFEGAIAPATAARQARAFKAAGVNLVVTESLRRIMRFEAEGKTAAVIDAIRMAAKACRREGMKIIHHTTASFVDQTLDGLPEPQRDWLSIDAQTGGYAFEPLWGGWYLWCLNHPDFRAEYFRLCRLYAAETGLDGFMVDEVYFRPGWYNCVCPHCRAKFRKMTGFDVPPADRADFWGQFDNPAFRAWVKFRCVSVGDFYQDLIAAVKTVHPHPVLMGCKSAETLEGGQRYGDNAQERMRGVNTLFIELTAGVTSLLHSWRYISANLMVYAGLSRHYGTPTVAVMYHRESERFLSWAMRKAHGMRVKATSSPVELGEALGPENHLLNYPADYRAYREGFAWERRHAGTLDGPEEPFAHIAIVFSESSRDLRNHGPHMDYAREFMGWGECLTDAGLQYAFLPEMDIRPERLQAFAVVILPNVLCLNDRTCQALLAYVDAGGGLVLTHRSGTLNLDGSPRTPAQCLSACLGLNDALATARGVVFGERGRGKWAYFPHRPGPVVFDTINRIEAPRKRDDDAVPAYADAERRLQDRLMREAVRWAAAAPMPLRVDPVPPGLLIKAFRKLESGDVIIHLLNLRGADAVAYGEWIPREAETTFPPLEQDLRMTLRLAGAQRARVFSPDWKGVRPLRLRPNGDDAFTLTFPQDALQRYAVVHIQRQTP